MQNDRANIGEVNMSDQSKMTMIQESTAPTQCVKTSGCLTQNNSHGNFDKALEADDAANGMIISASTYSSRGMWEIACLDLTPPETIWNGIALAPRAIYGIAGAPGIGKSRVILDLARHQVLGRDFLERATLKRPLKWLFVGSENDLYRLNSESCHFIFHTDVKEMRGKNKDERIVKASENGFSIAELELLDANIKLFTLEQADDCYISLADETNQKKLTMKMAIEKPDVVVIDPWGDLIAGDELNDGDVRATVQKLRQCENEAGITAPFFIVCHARIGAHEEAKARGMDEGKFMKNSKCLYSITRYFLNVRRASFDDDSSIELVCAKNNNGIKPSPVAGKLDPVSMSYQVIANHDADAWQQELENFARTQSRRSSASIKSSVVDVGDDIDAVLDEARKDAANVGKPFGGMAKGELREKVRARCLERNISFTDKMFRNALAYHVETTKSRTDKTKVVAVSEPYDSRREYVGSPDEIAWVMEAKKSGGAK